MTAPPNSQDPRYARAIQSVAGMSVIAATIAAFLDTPAWFKGASLGATIVAVLLSRWRAGWNWRHLRWGVCIAAGGVLGGAGGLGLHALTTHSNAGVLTLQGVLRQAAGNGLTPDRSGVDEPQIVQLRPSGEQDVFVFRPTSDDSRQSDELQIWDLRSGGLHLAYRFRPAAGPALDNDFTSANLGTVAPKTAADRWLITGVAVIGVE